ncbi:hypothetical protein ABZP36_002681 [Zizania latifolia]
MARSVVMMKGIVAVAAVAALAAQLAAAVVHPVGGNGAWDTSGNYNAWAASHKFSQGDSILFTYPSSHDVVEVAKAGYDACSAANAISSYTGGSTTVKLSAPGKRYFICGVPGHCAAGMKLEVTVSADATKPRHQRSVALAPAPAEAMTPASPTEEMPTVSSPTGAPAPSPASSGASSIAKLGAKSAAALATGMAALAFFAM